MPNPTPDFTLTIHGSVAVLTPHTPEGRDWCDYAFGHMDDMPRWMGGYALRPQDAQNVVETLAAEGLTVADLTAPFGH